MVDAFPHQAVIHFTITSVSYDPEDYTVVYGTSMDTLTTVSRAFNHTDPTGLTFFADTNLKYSITLDELKSYQMYYYLIRATNSHGSSSSTIGTFTTAQTSEEYFLAFFYVILK